MLPKFPKSATHGHKQEALSVLDLTVVALQTSLSQMKMQMYWPQKASFTFEKTENRISAPVATCCGQSTPRDPEPKTDIDSVHVITYIDLTTSTETFKSSIMTQRLPKANESRSHEKTYIKMFRT